MNPLSARRSTGSAPHHLKLVDGALAVEEDRPMVPKGIWSVVDGLTAIKWAWILIQLGTEKAIVAYVDWWIGKARLRSHQLDAVVDYTGMPRRTGLRRRCASVGPSRGLPRHHRRQPGLQRGDAGVQAAGQEDPRHPGQRGLPWRARRPTKGEGQGEGHPTAPRQAPENHHRQGRPGPGLGGGLAQPAVDQGRPG